MFENLEISAATANKLSNLMQIITDACQKIKKVIATDIPTQVIELRNKSGKDIEKSGEIFFLYSCGQTSLYLIKKLKEAGFENISLCMGQNDEPHFFIKIQEKDEYFIIDNKTAMEIHILHNEMPKDKTGKTRSIAKEWENISEGKTLLNLIDKGIIEKILTVKKITQKKLTRLCDCLKEETKANYQARRCYGNHQLITTITPGAEEYQNALEKFCHPITIQTTKS